jgi:hypothetical protein
LGQAAGFEVPQTGATVGGSTIHTPDLQIATLSQGSSGSLPYSHSRPLCEHGSPTPGSVAGQAPGTPAFDEAQLSTQAANTVARHSEKVKRATAELTRTPQCNAFTDRGQPNGVREAEAIFRRLQAQSL